MFRKPLLTVIFMLFYMQLCIGYSPAIAERYSKIEGSINNSIFPNQRFSDGQKINTDKNSAKIMISKVISPKTDKKSLITLLRNDNEKVSSSAKFMLNLLVNGVNHTTAAHITRLSFLSQQSDPSNEAAEKELLNIVTGAITDPKILLTMRKESPTNIREAADLMISLNKVTDNSQAAKIVILSNKSKYRGNVQNSKISEELLSIVTSPAASDKLLRVLVDKSTIVSVDAKRMLKLRKNNVNHDLAARVVLLLNRSMQDITYNEYKNAIDGLLAIINDSKTPTLVIKAIDQSNVYRVKQLANNILNQRNGVTE